MPQHKRNWFYLIVLIIAGESIFFLPFVIPRVFRATILQVFEITNLQLGTYFSVYGVVAMISYFLGGPLADRFSVRKLMALALWATAAGGLTIGFWPDSSLLPWMYGYWGFTTIFLFWAALIRSTREWGGEYSQGVAFGFLEGGRGLVAALIGLAAVMIFAEYMVEGDTVTSGNRYFSYRLVLFSCAGVVAFAGLLVWWKIPDKIILVENSQWSLDKVLQLVRLPGLWINALIIVCAYVGYKITDDYALYAHEVLRFDEVQSAQIGGAILWWRAVFAVLSGYLLDRWSGYRVIFLCFLFMCLGGALVATGWLEIFVGLVIMNLIAILAGVYGLRGVYFAVMKESQIPWALTGTAVGIMSFVGYTPDVFMSPLMGYLLDTYPGAEGHRYLFAVLSGFGLLGLLLTLFSLMGSKK